MKYPSILFVIVYFLSSCKSQSIKPIDMINDYYSKIKKDDSLLFISHFPQKIISDSSRIVNNKSSEKNKISFILYQYNISDSQIQEFNKILKKGYIAKYSSIDTCLFILQKNELQDIINKNQASDCLNYKYPIPNFIEYNDSFGIYNDDSFEIYVLESDTIDKFHYNMKPSAVMPERLKNGYSKGISISNKLKTLIYWSIAW